MNRNRSRFVRDKGQMLLPLIVVALLVWTIVWAVREITCDWTCEARRAAERHVDALAENDYDSYAANVFNASRDAFEFQQACLDWGEAKVGEVYDFSESPAAKSVALHTPSGDFFLTTTLGPPQGNDLEGKSFMASAASDACPGDLGPLLRSLDQDE